MGEPIRLQKILASAGFGSRRGCEVFITEGRVSVDGAVVAELGAKADIESQSVELDGRKIAGPGKLSKSMRENDERVYYALNKPKGALCTNDDPAGRPVAVQMIPEKRRIFCVGRLDLDTEGLILLTNDGDLTNRLTHPRYGVPKTYLARVEGEMGPTQMRKLQTGMHLAEGRTQGAKVRVRRKEGRHCVLEITISEGMNRQVRRMLARVELKCRSLKRIGIGPIKLGEMEAGEFRRLTTDELERLNLAISEAENAGKAPKEGKPERAAKPHREERSERFEHPDRSSLKSDRADKNAFKKSERGSEVEPDEDDEDEFDDDDEDAFAAASALVGKSGEAANSKRRVIASDYDEDEVEVEDDDELDLSEENTSMASLASDGDDEEDEELAELERKDAEADSKETTDIEDEEENDDAEGDEISTHEAVRAMDESRPWEKVASKGGKAWADRGDSVHDPELVAAAAEHEREAAKMLKEKMAGQTDDIREVRDRGVKTYPSDKRLRAGERKPRESREGRDSREERPRPFAGGGDNRGGSRGGKPFEKRGAGRDARPLDGEKRAPEYGRGHTPRPWEKSKEERGSARPRTFSKPGGFDRAGGSDRPRSGGGGSDRGGNSDRPRSYSKPGGFDKAGGSDRPRSGGGGFDRGGSSDRPRSYSKPGGFDKAGGSDRPRGGGGGFDRGGSSDRPRSYSKPGGFDKAGGSDRQRGGGGGFDRGGSSDRPRSYSKPGGFDKAGGSDRPRGGGGGFDRGGSSDRPRSYSKPGGFSKSGGSDRPRSGGYDRGGSSDRPKTFSKPGGYPRSGGGDSRGGERKPWVKREGSDSRGERPRGDSRERGARPEAGSGSRSRPWENARPASGERSEGGGAKSTRPWEKKRDE